MYNNLNFYSSLPYEHISPLVEAYSKLTYKDQFKFPHTSIRNFFLEWKRYENEGPKDYLKQAVTRDSFDGRLLLNTYISGEKFGSANMPDIRDFVYVFEDSIGLLLERLRGTKLGEFEQKAYDILEHNWKHYLS